MNLCRRTLVFLLISVTSAARVSDLEPVDLGRGSVTAYIEQCTTHNTQEPSEVNPATLELNKCMPPDEDQSCAQPVLSYHFDADAGECVRNYSCDAEHMFDTLHECSFACEHPCQQKWKSGYLCENPPRQAYYYDERTRTCNGFQYKGCGATKNLFNDIEDCQVLCNVKKATVTKAVAEKVSTKSKTPNQLQTSFLEDNEFEDVTEEDNSVEQFCDQFEQSFPEVVQKIQTMGDESDSQLNTVLTEENIDETDETNDSEEEQAFETDENNTNSTNEDFDYSSFNDTDVQDENVFENDTTLERSRRSIINTIFRRLNFISVVKNDASRRFDVTVRIKCIRSVFNRPSTSEARRLCGLIRSGIRKYWSRYITYQGRRWYFNVNAVEKSLFTKRVIIKYYTRNAGNTRSHNSDIYFMTMKYRAYLGRSRASIDFEETAAHEAGHSVLWAIGGLAHSWQHKGTSTILGSTRSPPATTYPRTGEIDLMKYWVGGRPFDYYRRVKLTQSDALGLIQRASRPRGALCLSNRHCLSGKCSGARCVDCESDSHCPSTHYCWGLSLPLTINECRSRLGRGKVCGRDRQCSSGHCDGFRCGDCDNDSDCPSGQFCRYKNVPFVTNRCENKRCKGWCSRGSMCRSGKCRFFRCKRC